jgi:uncharacterized protein YggE
MKWLLVLLFSPVLFAADLQGVQVQGSCDIKVVPDRGSVSFTTENQSMDQQEAVKKTNAQMNDLKEKIQKLKLEGIEFKTTNYYVHPVREYEKDHYVDKGTKVSMTMEITTSEISRLGSAMLEASKARIQNVGQMVTFLSLEKSQSEYLKCLDIAANDARKKAEQLAKKLGFKVGDVKNLVESPTQSNAPIPIYAKSMMTNSLRGAEAAPVEAGTQNFSTNIQVTFEIK